MKYYWIWSLLWALCALAAGIDGGMKKALYLAFIVFIYSFYMWIMCYAYYLREER